MEDTPQSFVEEFRIAILRKRVGQIALAVVIAEALWRFLDSMVWLLMVPVIAKTFLTHSDSVLFNTAAQAPIPWERLIGSLLEFLLTLIVVFYLNRWIHRKPKSETMQAPAEEFNSVGERIPDQGA
jgi:large-conductance mechanosensitive channel